MLISNEQPESQTSVTVRPLTEGDFCIDIEGPFDDTQTAAIRGRIFGRLRMQMEQNMVGADSRSNYRVGDWGVSWTNDTTTCITMGDSTPFTFPVGTGTTNSTATIITDNSANSTTGAITWGEIGGNISQAVNQYMEVEWNGTFGNVNWKQVNPYRTPKDRLRDIIRSRKAPAAIIRSSRNALPVPKDVREKRARETMRRVLGEREFRRFMRHGFVSIHGKSGYDYQIFPGQGVTSVFNRGVLIERLCVVLRGNFCPTDSLMMRYLMILNDEEQFRSFAIKHSVEIYTEPVKEVDNRPLLEIYRELKQQEQKAAA